MSKNMFFRGIGKEETTMKKIMKVNTRLTRAEYEELKAFAEQHNINLSSALRYALKNYVKGGKK